MDDSDESSSGYEARQYDDSHMTKGTFIMEGGAISRSTNITLLKRHIASFEKLLQYATSRFFPEKLHEKLLVLERTLKRLSNEEEFQDFGKYNLLSVVELRVILKKLKRITYKKSGRDKDIQIARYFESFLEDLQFLKELKRYFDDRIHRTLYENFYDPVDEFQETENTNRANMSIASRALYDLSSKWDRINEEGEITDIDFDIESLQNIRSLNGRGQFGRKVLRIFPDNFVKAYKAADYARSWLRHAVIVFKDHSKPRTVQEVTRKELELKERVLSLTLEIAQIESDLETEYEELNVLRHKECRHLELDKKQKKIAKLKYSADSKVAALQSEKEKFYSENKSNLPAQTFKHKCIDIDRRVLEAEHDLNIINFQLNLLEEDYDLEVLLLPEIVMCILELESNIKSLETTLKNKKVVRHTTEANLTVLKKNCAKMKEVIGKYNKRNSSGISVETNEAGDTLSTGRSEATPSDLIGSPETPNYYDTETGETHSDSAFMVDKGTGMTPGEMQE